MIKEILIDVDPEEPRDWKEWIVIEGFSGSENVRIFREYQEQDRPRQIQEINDDVLLIPKRNLKDLIKALIKIQDSLTEFDVRYHNDSNYNAPEPWTTWDLERKRWVCKICGAGFNAHNWKCTYYK